MSPRIDCRLPLALLTAGCTVVAGTALAEAPSVQRPVASIEAQGFGGGMAEPPSTSQATTTTTVATTATVDSAVASASSGGG